MKERKKGHVTYTENDHSISKFILCILTIVSMPYIASLLVNIFWDELMVIVKLVGVRI